MKIKQVICAPGRTGFYFDDQKAIKAGAPDEGSFYLGEAMTEGFYSIRQPGESIAIMLELEDGQIAYGDCAAVQYSGAGGRYPLFLASEFIPLIENELAPKLCDLEISSFKETMDIFEDDYLIGGKHLHTAIRYGLSQAVLDAVARSTGRLMCEVVADEYGTRVSERALPIFSQSGDDRYKNADKMIIKEVDVLPHALINNMEKLGPNGDHLADYLFWLRERVLRFRAREDYEPVFHIDVYGTIGELFGTTNIEGIADYLKRLEAITNPFKLRIEGPLDAGTKEGQIKWLAELTRAVDEGGIAVELVADEWCNTYEDVKDFVDHGAGHMIQVKTPDLGSLHKSAESVLYCKAHGVKAYQGGTCNETARSAQVSVHVAMATSPEQILAKPGMGVDEGIMLAYNEMQQILALRKHRQ
ncbi:MAG: methylaspartate ammonia-lyase [Clostridiaceae bacterium]|jgi:methylaspartate ammonia-lyase|nr:methylaspartate ammonia-lyase [Clostridiaceae bacterium]